MRAARGPKDPDILEEQPNSVKTGRSVEALAGEAPGWSSKTGKIDKNSQKVGEAEWGERLRRRFPGSANLKARKKRPCRSSSSWRLQTLEKKDTGRGALNSRDQIRRLSCRRAESTKAASKLLTRSGLDWTRKFGGRLVEALQSLPVKTALIDGEVVVENNAGASDFLGASDKP